MRLYIDKVNPGTHGIHTSSFSFLELFSSLDPLLLSDVSPLLLLSSSFLLWQATTCPAVPLSASMGDPNHPHGQPCLWPVACAACLVHGGPPLHKCHEKEKKSSPGPPLLQKGSTIFFKLEKIFLIYKTKIIFN